MVDIECVEGESGGQQELVCKLADFGFACMLEQDLKCRETLGTLAYMAPEIVVKGASYDNKVDTWALGVLAYIMLCA